MHFNLKMVSCNGKVAYVIFVNWTVRISWFESSFAIAKNSNYGI
jgi:hypothetical protein